MCIRDSGGLDLRYYKGTHKAVLVDLYGGDYYVDSESRKNVKAENNALAQDCLLYTSRCV